MNKRSFTFLSMLLVLSFAAHAQQKSSLSTTVVKAKKESPFHISATLDASSNLYDDESSERTAANSLDVTPSVDLNDRFRLAVRSILTHQQTQAKDTTISDTFITLGIKGPAFTKQFTSAFLVRGVAPTSENAKKVERFQGAGILGGALTWTNEIVLLKYSLLLRQNSHEYNINASGSPNIQYSLGHEFQFAYEFVPKWSISTTAAYRKGWTYGGFERQIYAYGAELGYDITKQWNIAAGVETNGDVFKPNGRDTNLKFYDENTSTIRASVTFTN